MSKSHKWQKHGHARQQAGNATGSLRRSLNSLPSTSFSPPAGYSPANSNTRIQAPRPFSLPRPHGLQGTEAPSSGSMGLTSDRQRARLVQLLRDQGIDDERVLAAMQATPRHLFVDEGLASRAYENAALPIGHGQTISQPWVVAYMLSLVSAGRQPGRVLEVGAGCGYQAAVMGQFMAEVHAVERIRGLYDLARKNLAAVRIRHRVRLHFGDGFRGLESLAPFDAIVVAAAGVKIPDALMQQLAVGARLIAPEGTNMQRLVLIERTATAAWQRTELEEVRFVPLRSGTQR